MSPIDAHTAKGAAAIGWQVSHASEGRWRWHAYGPQGAEAGEAATEETAVSFATQAVERLRQPRLRPVS